MTLATHIGAAPPRPARVGDAPTRTEEAAALERAQAIHFGALDKGDWGIRTVYALCMFGVFERHPNLRLVLTEIPGVFWNEIALKMDSVHLAPHWVRDWTLRSLPSEYMATNVWMGNSFRSRREAVAAIEIGRADRFLWGSDYPHVEGTFCYSDDADEYPMTRLSLAFTYHDLPLDRVRQLVGENALAAYPRLDRDALSHVAERVGRRSRTSRPPPTSVSTPTSERRGRWVSGRSAPGADCVPAPGAGDRRGRAGPDPK